MTLEAVVFNEDGSSNLTQHLILIIVNRGNSGKSEGVVYEYIFMPYVVAARGGEKQWGLRSYGIPHKKFDVNSPEDVPAQVEGYQSVLRMTKGEHPVSVVVIFGDGRYNTNEILLKGGISLMAQTFGQNWTNVSQSLDAAVGHVRGQHFNLLTREGLVNSLLGRNLAATPDGDLYNTAKKLVKNATPGSHVLYLQTSARELLQS